MNEPIAILTSGGLDSCVLASDMATQAIVYPIYIKNGLCWEGEEIQALHAFIDALHNQNIRPLTVLDFPIASIYGSHWSVTGKNIPTRDDPDLTTCIPGRNILLITCAALWCRFHNVHKIALASLSSNPFSDASMEFFQQLSSTLSVGLDFPISVEAPYREKYSKKDLIQTHPFLPLELTITCMAPTHGIHCGQCNKCKERQESFQKANVIDRTKYAQQG